jgi:hypothetical protein
MDLLERVDDVGKRIALAPDDPPLEFDAAPDHRIQQGAKVIGRHLASPRWRPENWGETDGVKIHPKEKIERLAEPTRARRDGGAHRNLHSALAQE